jgi:Transcription factor WhiB
VNAVMGSADLRYGPSGVAVDEPPRLDRTVPDWHDQAACRAFPQLNWVHPGEVDAFTRAPLEERQAAEYACRLICSVCPVRLECAVGALERQEPHGIWGGLDRADRKQVAARYGYLPPGDPPAHGTNSRRVKWGCACRDCKDAHARYESDRRARKRRALQFVAPPPPGRPAVAPSRHRRRMRAQARRRHGMRARVRH